MTKPDDVSAEAWEAAEVAAKEATRDAMRDPLMPYYITVTPHIARAIDAAIAKERERCAQAINDKAEEIRSVGTVTANTMARIFDEQSAAIRKGA